MGSRDKKCSLDEASVLAGFDARTLPSELITCGTMQPQGELESAVIATTRPKAHSLRSLVWAWAPRHLPGKQDNGQRLDASIGLMNGWPCSASQRAPQDHQVSVAHSRKLVADHFGVTESHIRHIEREGDGQRLAAA